VADFFVDQEFRDDARRFATTRDDSIGDGAHKPDAAAAVDQFDAGIGHRCAERDGGVSVHGVRAGA
jgi:hypothetical protein